MFNVEYLILVDNKKASCTTVGALLHLLQSDSDIAISADGREITYKQKTSFLLEVVKGDSKTDDDPSAQNIYFDIKLVCKKSGDLQEFSQLLRSVRKVSSSLLATPAALQVLWDDVSVYYAGKAYPLISDTENRMRKLITKFMHINLGIAWLDSRIPDDVQKSINTSNTDTTYLYNVDFIKLKDILLSESYSKDRDALIKELRNQQKKTFKREEIESLIPISNWEKYFNNDVSFDAQELSGLWTQLYDLRCKVAHNKTFSLDDLTKTKKLSKKINSVLNEAIEKLDRIHVDKNEASKIVDDAVTKVSKIDSQALRDFMDHYRELCGLTYKLTTPFNKPANKHRNFMRDVSIMKTEDYITTSDIDLIRDATTRRNLLVHNISDDKDTEGLTELNIRLSKLNNKLSRIKQAITH